MTRTLSRTSRVSASRAVLVLLLLTGLIVACDSLAGHSTPTESPTPSPTWTAAVSPSPVASPTVIRTPTRPPSPTAFITPPAPGQSALVPILMYHHLGDLGANASESDRTWTVAPRNFEAQMAWLAAQGFHTITFPQLVAFFKRGQALPARPVIITFDDGWREGYAIAFPILLKYRLAATFFVYTSAIGHSQSLTWEQISEMSAAGMEIESHTLTHPHLRTMPAEEAYKEIADSRAVLEKRLGKKVTTFNYPFGEYDAAVADLVKRAGFESAVTINPGFKQRAEDIFSLRRNRVTYRTTLEDLSKLVP